MARYSTEKQEANRFLKRQAKRGNEDALFCSHSKQQKLSTEPGSALPAGLAPNEMETHLIDSSSPPPLQESEQE